ncbi:PP2C family protein-serine/threonine phosphatase [Streptomyces purpurogeneiscleroticus]|uniref:PP2C family protein-serine/threonine phosphatase n=1 Tax=Streptomyces purpurogeneiscleroticus TaxID=68259 RepID=UPI001CBB9703|nr:PP2C family protein-serine/threonine phosphatase [Streptomyces purpurogeneiscleroticus]
MPKLPPAGHISTVPAAPPPGNPARLIRGTFPLALATVCALLGRGLDLPQLFLPLMPAVAALPAIWRSGGRDVLGAGAAALGGVAVLGWGARPGNAIAALAGVLTVIALIRAAARRSRRQESKLARLGRLAQVTQAAVLPRPPESVGGVRLDARYLAATPGATVGGDICGAERTPFGVRLLIGDVSGKGLDVVATAAETLHIWRELAHHESSLAGIALRMDTAVTRIHHHDGFVTALLINVYDDGRVELLSCGHPPPLLVRDGRATWLAGLDATAPLGLMRMVQDRCPTAVVRPAPDDWLLLCTDGVAECRNEAGEFYPLAERLTALCGREPTAVLDALEVDLARHRDGGCRDDAMMLLIRPPSRQHST